MLRLKTQTTIADALQMLATLTDEEIQAKGVGELRSMLRDTGVNHLMREGVPVPIRSGRKDELVQEIQKLAHKQQALNNAVIPISGVGQVVESPVVELMTTSEMVEVLRKVPLMRRIDGDKLIAKVAHEFISKLALAYPDTSSQLRFNVRCSRRSERLKDLREVFANEPEMLEVFESFRTKCLEFGESDSIAKRKANDANTEAKIEQETEMRISRLLKWAQGTLAGIGNVGKTQWKEVVLALALVTGRRMNEILCIKTTFEKSGEYSIDCKGLSKSHDGEAATIENITTLCPSDYVIAAIDWLRRDDHKRYTDEPSQVNKRYGKELSQLMKAYVEAFDIINEDARTKQEPGENGRIVAVFNFHSLRKAYVSSVLAKGDLQGRTAGKEAARLLGHAKWQTAVDNYSDSFVLADADAVVALL